MNKRTLNPSAVELLMRCYYSPVEHPQIAEQFMLHAAADLRILGLLKENSMCTLTPRGNAYVEAILRVPLPEQAWVIGDEILVRG